MNEKNPREINCDMHEQQKRLDDYLGKRLREKRQSLGYTLCDLAEKLSVSHQQIQKYEQAQSRISAITLYQLSEILGVEPSYFFQGYDAYNKKQDKHNGCSDIIMPDRQSALNILIVEDDAADELVTRRAFTECSIPVNLLMVHDGMVALEFLRNRTTRMDFPRPDLILLDLSLPKNDGLSILRELKRDRDICDIPVIILTNSINFSEMVSCYKGHVAGFMSKSFDYEILLKNFEYFVRYWSQVMILPNRSHGIPGKLKE